MTSFEYVSKVSASLLITPQLFHYFQPIQGSLSPSALLPGPLRLPQHPYMADRVADHKVSLSVPSPCNLPFANAKPFALPSKTLGSSPDRAMPHPTAHIHTASSLLSSLETTEPSCSPWPQGLCTCNPPPCIHPSLYSGLRTAAAPLQKPLEPFSEETPARHISFV